MQGRTRCRRRRILEETREEEGCRGRRSLVQEAPPCRLRWRIEGPPRRRPRWRLHEAPPCRRSNFKQAARRHRRKRIEEARRHRRRWRVEEAPSCCLRCRIQKSRRRRRCWRVLEASPCRLCGRICDCGSWKRHFSCCITIFVIVGISYAICKFETS
jgi:hypothetical protein